MTSQPHNNFFITVFSHRQNMVDLLTQLLPEVASSINVDSLELNETSYVDEQLKDLYSDIVYTCKSQHGKEMKVSLLFEHKSYPVTYPRFQLLDYMLSIFRNDVKNGQPLSLIIPIIFYHGETPWKYRSLTSYYEGIEERFKGYIPDFNYHVIDLTQYSDEEILSLKFGFLINSLIAFKHKNDGDYVRKHAERIYHRIEAHHNSDYSQVFFKVLSIYLMTATKIKMNEMIEIVETLPKEGQETLKSTYENFVDHGISIGKEQGVSIGKARGAELERLKLTLEAIKSNLDDAFITSFLKVPNPLVKWLRVNVSEKFEAKEFTLILAKELLETFTNLDVKDIAEFCQLNVEDVAKLKEKIS